MTKFALKGLLGRKLRTALTALAIVLGVAMISGTYVLTDSIDSAFDTIFTEVRKGSSAVVTGKAAFDLSGESDATLTMSTIQQAVAREWGVTPDGLKSKTRTKTLTTPRQVAMFLSRELLGMQLVEIGNAFGGRDHSTVIHSLDRVAAAMQEDRVFSERVGKIRVLLESMRL